MSQSSTQTVLQMQRHHLILSGSDLDLLIEKNVRGKCIFQDKNINVLAMTQQKSVRQLYLLMGGVTLA